MTSLTRNRLPNAADAFGWWRRFEAPTLALAFLVHVGWAALIYWHGALPAPLLFVLGGCIGQLHSSLQHEAIHALRHVPRPLRWALVWAPLGLWLPYPLYHRSHSRHHVNFHLTHPEKDTESVYHSARAWNRYGTWRKALIAANQTLAFRMVVGPWLKLGKFTASEWGKLLSGDFRNAGIWVAHAAGVAPIVWFVSQFCGMRLVDYLLFFVYPTLMLGALRSFTEHRWDVGPHERVAIVESNALFGLLYLYNNLHHIHHRSPTMPWYEIPGHFRRHRAEVLRANGNFYFRGYAQIAWRYLFRPVFRPVHPHW